MNELAEVGKEMAAGKSGVERFIDTAKEPKWIVFAPVASAKWSLAAVVPEREVMDPVYRGQKRLSSVMILGLACMACILFIAAGRITRPIVKLTEAAQSLAEGNLDTRVSGISGNDEIANLAKTFNRMVVDLKTNIDARVREEKARAEVESEMNAAREIQTSLLPKPIPHSPGDPFSLHAVNSPAKSVAGDFYDFFRIDNRRLAIALADVSGKGLPAAMYMASACAKLRALASPDISPSEVISKLNRLLSEDNDRDMFVGIFFGYYDVLTGELIYVNAGQNPPYLVRQDVRLEKLDPTGPLVAPFANSVYEEAQLRVEPGDTLVAYTDGITEGHSGDFNLFGEERLERLLRNSASQPVDALCNAVVEAVREFSAGALKDDVTILALRRERGGL
jgi:phosphoserine phosphatase RsbU/P